MEPTEEPDVNGYRQCHLAVMPRANKPIESFTVTSNRISLVQLLALAMIGLLLVGSVVAQEPKGEKDMQRDVVLVAKLTSAAKMEAGNKPTFKLTVTNNSSKYAYPMVKPGDGSEVGWRSPHVYSTVEFLGADKTWQEVKPPILGRCGLYNSQWEDDIFDLKPKTSLEIKDWISAECASQQFVAAGKYRIVWRYVVDNKLSKANLGSDSKEEPAEVKKIGNFQLASKPIEIEVTKPLNLKLAVSGKVTAGPMATNGYQRFAFDNALTVTLKNESDLARALVKPTQSGDARLHFEITKEGEKESLSWPSIIGSDLEAAVSTSEKFELAPQESTVLLGDQARPNMSYFWETAESGKFKIRAVFHSSTWKNGPVLYSPWQEIVLPSENAATK